MLSTLKSLARRVLRAAGFELVHRTDDELLHRMLAAHEYLRLQPVASHEWEDRLTGLAAAVHLRRLLHRLEIDLVLDVGANEGQFGRQLRALGYAGEIISFEPGPAALTRLRSTVGPDLHWQIRPVAVGRSPGEIRLYIAANDVFSSTHAATETGRTLFGTMLESRQTATVPLTSLDALWPELAGGRPRRILLKSDTQGHELEVLSGATQVLAACAAVQLEGAYKRLYADSPEHTALVTHLAAAGFEPAGIFPIAYDARNHGLLEADLFFVRARP